MGCLSFAKGSDAKGAKDAKSAQANVRKPRRPGWLHVRIDMNSGMRRQSLMDGSDYIEPQEDTGILLYIRVAGVDVERVMLDPFMAGVVRTDFVCCLAESVGTLPSCVKDFDGNAGMLSEVPCHPSQGLIFGGFLPTTDLHRHHGASVATVKDILAVIRSDAVVAKLKASASMPQYSLSPDGSIHFEFFAAEGAPDPPNKPGLNCPWDLWTKAWDLWSIVPPADIVGEARPDELVGADALKSKDKTCSEATSDDTSYVAEDHPDTLLSHRSTGSERLVASSHWCLPAVVDLDCESREKLSNLLETMSREASRRRCRPRQRIPNMSGERPPRWWLEAQPVPGCESLEGPCWCAAETRAPLELLIKEPTCDDDVLISGRIVVPCPDSHRSVITILSLPTSRLPQSGIPAERPSNVQ